jgi:four helix bundle protein
LFSHTSQIFDFTATLIPRGDAALVDALPNSVSGRTIADQIARSATSVAANYRAACRAKSTADFISKMGTVEEEADELVAITVSSINTARRNRSTSAIRNLKSELES